MGEVEVHVGGAAEEPLAALCVTRSLRRSAGCVERDAQQAMLP